MSKESVKIYEVKPKLSDMEIAKLEGMYFTEEDFDINEVEDDEVEKQTKKPFFTDAYVLPPIYELKLTDPTRILERAMERTKRERAKFRA